MQTVSGVGPRLALAMLSVLAPDRLRAAVTADLATLTKVPGIGKKGAERIVLELRDKLGMPSGAAGAATAAPAVGAAAWRDQVPRRSPGSATPPSRPRTPVSKAAEAAPAGADVSAMLRAALRELGR